MKIIPLQLLALSAISCLALILSSVPGIAAETPPDALLAALAGPLEKEFGHKVETEFVYQKKIAVVTAYSIKFKLKAAEIDKTWADKFIRSLIAAGAANAKVTITKDIGPAEVRATDFEVEGFAINEIQLVGRPGEEDVVSSFSVLAR